MTSVLQYPFITPYEFTTMFFNYSTPLEQWLLHGKIAENPIITPSTSAQVVRPSAVNRYLESVTVEAKA